MARLKICIKYLVIFAVCFLLTAQVSYAKQLSLGMDPDDKQDAAVGSDVPVDANWDEKIDTAIEILTVVKEELKESEKENAAAAATAVLSAAGAEDAGWKDTLRSSLSRLGRVWNKVKKITVKDAEDGSVTPVTQENEGITEEGLRSKLDKTIEAMKIIREELEKIKAD